MIEFIVDGQPQRKRRPRFRRVGNFVRTYTPKETHDYEKHIADCYLEQVGNVIFEDIPIKVKIIAYFEIPKAFSKRKRQEAITHIIKPNRNRLDVDNIAKVVLDALNGVAYADDRSITDLTIRKRYAEQPRLEISIGEVKE